MSINYLELIDGMEFPASLIEIVDKAQDSGGSEEAVEMFRALPDKEYRSITEVSNHLIQVERLPGEDSESISTLAEETGGDGKI